MCGRCKVYKGVTRSYRLLLGLRGELEWQKERKEKLTRARLEKKKGYLGLWVMGNKEVM